MNWSLVSTEDQDLVLDLYCRVFGEILSSAEIERRRDRRIHFYVLRDEDASPAGFAIFTGKGNTVDFWHGGVLPEKQRRGAGKALLQEAEHNLADLGYQVITASTYNRWNIMLSMLTRRGYRIVGTELSAKRGDLKIRLQYELRRRRELRISLTEKCNFDCFFCHLEGLEKDSPESSDEHMIHVLDKAIKQGYNDLTFTGGEPLLRSERLRKILSHLAIKSDWPDVTVVTNGYLLDDPIIAMLRAYPGKLKVHISLHAADEETFRRVTRIGKQGVFARVKDNIRRATAAGLPIKINHVVLQGYNHKTEQIGQTIEMARDLGAMTLKFLELLVIADTAELFESYYEADAIRRAVEHHLKTDGERVNLRQQRYHHPSDTRFSVEVQQLTCQLGCAQCRMLRDRTIGSDLRYHPCFVRTKEAFAIGPDSDLAAIFADGDRLIDGFASKYGDSSPTLLRHDKFIAERREMFFAIDDPEAFCEFLLGDGFEFSGKTMFFEEYYWPRNRSEDWEAYRRVLRIAWDSHNQSGVDLLYTDHDYRVVSSNAVETTTRYLFSSGPMRIDNKEKARHLLDRLDFERYYDEAWDLQIFTKSALELNVAMMGERSTVRVVGGQEAVAPYAEVFKRYPGSCKLLDRPLVAWIRGKST